jgi:hypothetical protein
MMVLKGDKALLAYSSLLIQVANFAVLVVAKAWVVPYEFANLLTQLALAGIVGSVASMRLEVLIFHQNGRLSRAAILIPSVATALVIGLAYALYGLTAALYSGMGDASFHAIPMMVGLSLSAITNFTFVQVRQLNPLLAMRVWQGLALAALMAALASGFWGLTGEDVLLLIGLAYAFPAIAYTALAYLRHRPDVDDPPALYLPDAPMLWRALSLSVSTGVNSVYVNMPLLAAASTQTASYVADFGLILRAFTAPITFIAQVIGRFFLADAITWSGDPERTPAVLWRMITRAMVQSVGIFVIAAAALVGLLYLFREPLNFTHLGIAPFLFLATLGQCAINPVSQVRIPINDEHMFLLFDSLRLVLLSVGLFALSQLLPFEVAFGLTAVVLYTGYIGFIRHRIAGLGVR